MQALIAKFATMVSNVQQTRWKEYPAMQVNSRTHKAKLAVTIALLAHTAHTNGLL